MIEIFTKCTYECVVSKCPDTNFCEREIVGKIQDREPWKSYPIVFSICQESRLFAQSAFGYCFAATPMQPPKDEDEFDLQKWLRYHEPSCEVATAGVHFQPKRDTIYNRSAPNRIQQVLAMSRVTSTIDTSAIRSLAMDDYLLSVHEHRR